MAQIYGAKEKVQAKGGRRFNEALASVARFDMRHRRSIIACFALQRSGRVTDSITTEHYQDLGKFLFAFGVVFWAYIAYSQYMLIWYANIPEETGWFAARQLGGWGALSIVLLVGHFVGPFLVILMPKPIKGLLLVFWGGLGRPGGGLFQGAVHPFMATIFLWMARSDAFRYDAQTHPPDRQAERPPRPVEAKGGPLSVRMAMGKTRLRP